MNVEGSHLETERFIADAIEDSRDGRLEPGRMEVVRQLLLTNADARRCYLRLNAIDHLLAANSTIAPDLEKSVSRWVSGKNSRHASATRWQLLLSGGAMLSMVAAAILTVIFVLNQAPPSQRAIPAAIASLEQINGEVTLTTPNAETRSIDGNIEVHSGDTVRTQGGLSSAVLVYPDKTRLSLVGSTVLTISGHEQKNLVLHGGTLLASVVTQPAAQPMLVATPQDKLRVLGTTFSLDATNDETELSVNEGLVELTRRRDGKSIEIPAGQRVVSHFADDLVSEPIPDVPDEWVETFEDGLPQSWEQGKFVTSDLPSGSKGAVRAQRIPTDDGELFNIATQAKWADGLFAVRDGTHLHLTLKMQDPGWFNILILTKTADGNPPTFAGNYIFDRPVWDQQETGAWGTLTIPLAEFRSLAAGKDSFRNAIPIQIVFSSPDKDRGLVIDRIRVTQDGPGTVKAIRLK